MIILGEPAIEGARGRDSRDIYFPIVGGPPPPPPNPVAEFCRFLVSDPRQERPHLERCPALELAAKWRAQGLVAGDPWDHVDAAGVTPNEYCRQAGCRLPADYAAKGNNVEELAAGSPVAWIIFDALANSPKHSDHLFGRGWFRPQQHFGVALAEGGEMGWYWVIMIATCESRSGE